MEFFLGTHERVRNSRGKRVMSVPATEVLLYKVFPNGHYRFPIQRIGRSSDVKKHTVNNGYVAVWKFAPLEAFLLQLPHEESVVDRFLGADCSLELHCHHNTHGCIVLSIILSVCLESLVLLKDNSSDLSWIVVNPPCFSEVRSFTRWYALLFFFFFFFFAFRQVSTSLHWIPIQSSFAFFTAFWILLLASLYVFTPASYRLFFKALLSSQRSHHRGRNSLVSHSLILRQSFPSTCISLAASVIAVL